MVRASCPMLHIRATYSNASFDSWDLLHHPHLQYAVLQESHLWIVPKPNYNGELNVTDDNLHYYTLPNSLDNDRVIQVLQHDTTAHQLEHYGDEVVKYWRAVKKSKRRRCLQRRKQEEIRKRAELLVQLKRELRQAHKLSKMKDGRDGIHWWAEMEFWKHLEVKKEEWSTPNPNIKVEELPTPNLLYPSNPSCYTSLDPNYFMNWGDLATT